jgi:integrase
VSLAEARKKAREYGAQRAKGIDPLAEKARQKAEQAIGHRTLAQAAEEFLAYQCQKKAGTKFPGRTAKAWRSALARFVYPVLGDIDVSDLRHAHVVAVLKPVSLARAAKHEGKGGAHVASALRSRLERASANGYRDADAVNPARVELLRDVLGDAAKTKHFAAPAIDTGPELYARIAAAEGSVYRAIEFLLLTAVRLRECLDARIEEFDLDKGLWVVPGERTKTGRPHVVPLSDAAAAIVVAQRQLYSGPVIFPGRFGAPFRSTSAWGALKRLGIGGPATLHGFRSLAADTMADRLDIDRETREFVLAHVPGGVEAAYRRETAVEKRRVAMQKYADFLAGKTPDTNVVAFAAKSRA